MEQTTEKKAGRKEYMKRYMKAYRKQNPERVKEITLRYYERKLEDERNKKEA